MRFDVFGAILVSELAELNYRERSYSLVRS
jgi:hypothetical protein